MPVYTEANIGGLSQVLVLDDFYLLLVYGAPLKCFLVNEVLWPVFLQV